MICDGIQQSAFPPRKLSPLDAFILAQESQESPEASKDFIPDEFLF